MSSIPARFASLSKLVALVVLAAFVASGCTKSVTLVEKKPYQVTKTVEKTEEVPASVVVRPFNGCVDDCEDELEARDVIEKWLKVEGDLSAARDMRRS